MYPPTPAPKEYVPYEDDEEEAHEMPELYDPVNAMGTPIDQQPLYDKLIHAEVALPQGDTLRQGQR